MGFNHVASHLLGFPVRLCQNHSMTPCHDAASSGSRQNVTPDYHDLLIRVTVYATAKRFSSPLECVSLGTQFIRERVDEDHNA